MGLKNALMECDKKDFFLDERITSDSEYISTAYVGGVKHLFNQTEDDTKIALKRYKFMKNVDFFLTNFFYCGLFYLLLNQFIKLVVN